MTDAQHIAIIDIGKTNAKLVLLDGGTGEELAIRRTQNRVIDASPYPHYDSDSLWAFIRSALADLHRNFRIDAISISAHGACMVLLDDLGNLALPIIDYEYIYPPHTQANYTAIRPSFAETFSPPLSGGLNAGAQLHFLKTNFPEDFATVRTILTYPQYWAYRLTGVAANELTSLGCHTDLWQPGGGKFSSLVDRLDLGPLMAPMRSAFDCLGLLLPELAQELDVQHEIAVYCGIHDSNASLLPHLLHHKPPFSVVSSGTWLIHFAVGGDLEHLDPTRDTLANVDAYGRAVPSSRFMGGREFELLTAYLGPLDPAGALSSLPSAIEKMIMLLPNLTAGSGPFPEMTSRWIGFEQASHNEKWAAACLYLALMSTTCLNLIGARDDILVEGPFAANIVYLEALAALTGRNVTALSGTTGTSQGAAMLAGAKWPPKAGSSVEPNQFEGLQAYKAYWQHVCDTHADALRPA